MVITYISVTLSLVDVNYQCILEVLWDRLFFPDGKKQLVKVFC